MDPAAILSRMVATQRIPHALLFCGPKGAGKKQAALDFAATLFQSKKTHHPDLHIFEPEGKTDMHPISSIRKLAEDAALAAFEANWKVFIIVEAEKMLPTSSNALLKTLEEPPSQTVIILLSDHPDRLLPTILSRCQKIEFNFQQAQRHDAATLELVARKRAVSDFESEDPALVFETLMLWYRDRLILEIKAPHNLLHFPSHLQELEATPFVPLEQVEKALSLSRLSYERSTKLSTCLEMFFLHL